MTCYAGHYPDNSAGQARQNRTTDSEGRPDKKTSPFRGVLSGLACPVRFGCPADVRAPFTSEKNAYRDQSTFTASNRGRAAKETLR